MMVRVLGLFCLAAGCACCIAGSELAAWAVCTPSDPVSPARCEPPGEDGLRENTDFPNCELNELGTECTASEGSVCGAFNGYGYPRAGQCVYHLEGSTVYECIENASEVEVELHYWEGGCAFDTNSDCRCVFTESQTTPTATATTCNCSDQQL